MTGNMVSAWRGRWPWPVSRWEYSFSHCEAARLAAYFVCGWNGCVIEGSNFGVEQVSEREDVWIWRFKIRRRGSDRKDRDEAEAYDNPPGPIGNRPGAKEAECALATWHRRRANLSEQVLSVRVSFTSKALQIAV